MIPPVDLAPVRRDRPVGRYAPSPTGDLHLGNLRTALAAWAATRREGGVFILRVEDIDAPRNVPDAEERLIEDLRWLGLDWDEGPDIGGPAGPYRQSGRGDIYAAALDRLARAGMIYICRCSRKDLREASAPHGPEGAIYPGTCRPPNCGADLRSAPSGGPPTDLSRNASMGSGDKRGEIAAQVSALLESPAPEASIRFRIPDDLAVIEFDDARLGPQRFDLRELCGDFVIRRRDGLWAYQFACAVDDALMGVTRVVRGEDLLTSSPRQIALIRALGWTPPVYEHVPLVVDETGKRMSKRDSSRPLRALREAGMSPAEVRGMILNIATFRSRDD